MAIKNKKGNLMEKTEKAAKSSNEPLTALRVKIDKTAHKKLTKGSKKLVNKMAHSVENMLITQAGEKPPSTKEAGGNRFRTTDGKTIAESVGLLSEEIRIYMEETEEIGVSKLLGMMKTRNNSEAMVFAAMGWLIRDSKIVISTDGKKVSLK